MVNPKISVVVPVYNVESYLRRCVDSILNQAFDDFEILLVDDGSLDGSGRICDEYSAVNPKVRTLHQKNYGVTKARESGVENSRGEWITFVDSDDYLPATALQDMYGEAVKNRYDIIVARYSSRKYPVEEITCEQNRSLSIVGKIMHSGPVARLIRKTLFDEHTLDIPRNVRKGEDMLMNIRLAFNNDKPVRLLSRKVYYYCRNSDSCMHTFMDNIENEELFSYHRMLSVPESERQNYIKEIIANKLNGIELICKQSKVNTWWNTEYFMDLMEEVDRYSYHLPAVTRLKMTTSNVFVFRSMKIIDKILHAFRKLKKYKF